MGVSSSHLSDRLSDRLSNQLFIDLFNLVAKRLRKYDKRLDTFDACDDLSERGVVNPAKLLLSEPEKRARLLLFKSSMGLILLVSRAWRQALYACMWDELLKGVTNLDRFIAETWCGETDPAINPFASLLLAVWGYRNMSGTRICVCSLAEQQRFNIPELTIPTPLLKRKDAAAMRRYQRAMQGTKRAAELNSVALGERLVLEEIMHLIQDLLEEMYKKMRILRDGHASYMGGAEGPHPCEWLSKSRFLKKRREEFKVEQAKFQKNLETLFEELLDKMAKRNGCVLVKRPDEEGEMLTEDEFRDKYELTLVECPDGIEECCVFPHELFHKDGTYNRTTNLLQLKEEGLDLHSMAAPGEDPANLVCVNAAWFARGEPYPFHLHEGANPRNVDFNGDFLHYLWVFVTTSWGHDEQRGHRLQYRPCTYEVPRKWLLEIRDDVQNAAGGLWYSQRSYNDWRSNANFNTRHGNKRARAGTGQD